MKCMFDNNRRSCGCGGGGKQRQRCRAVWSVVFVSLVLCATANGDDEPQQEQFACITTNQELQTAVQAYVQQQNEEQATNSTTTTTKQQVQEQYGPIIGDWCLSSNITSLAGLFRDMDTFNEPLAGWNTEFVSDFSYTFAGAALFDQDLSSW